MKKIITIIMLVPSICFGWGKTGHRVVGELASLHLTDLAKLQVKDLLKHESLATASVWPDRIKSDAKMRKKYSHLHYLNANKGKTVQERDKKKQGDILSAIEDFSKTLKDPKKPKKERVIALRFLVHLIGDLHQPLHTGYASDHGGNKVKVTWFGEKTNLHMVWDEKLINLEELSFTEYTKKLNYASKEQIKEWQSSKPLVWAQESRAYVEKAYEYKEAKYWEYNYSYQHLDFLNERLQRAGIRLAGHLNNLLK